jgi:hypothetical protein
MTPELVNFHLPTTDQFSVAVDISLLARFSPTLGRDASMWTAVPMRSRSRRFLIEHRVDAPLAFAW